MCGRSGYGYAFAECKGTGSFRDFNGRRGMCFFDHIKGSNNERNGLPIKECGVCWSTQKGTEPLDNMRNKRYTKADKIENHNFTATMSNLEDSTKYYVYAYAINDVDTHFQKQRGRIRQ